MATITLGTAATNTLIAVTFSQQTSSGGLLPADLATINQHILDDQNVSHPAAHLIGSGGLFREGLLYLPNRGGFGIKVLPGDIVAYDPATGWPILLSARAAAGASWVHS